MPLGPRGGVNEATDFLCGRLWKLDVCAGEQIANRHEVIALEFAGGGFTQYQHLGADTTLAAIRTDREG